MPIDLLTSAREFAEWNALAGRAPAGTLFHTTAWRECAEWRSGDRMLYAGWRDADGQLRAGVALVERRRWGLRLGVQPLGTPYLGFVADDVAHASRVLSQSIGHSEDAADNASHETMRRELFAWVARRFHYAYFQTPPEWPGPPAGSAPPPRWEAPARQTPLVDLGGEDGMWGRLRGNARRVIRRARESGWEIAAMDRPALFPDERESVRRLLAATHRRVGQAIYPEPFIERLLASEALTGHRLVLWARPGLGAEPGALLAVVFDARRAYYLLPLADEAALKAGAIYLLIWEAMRRLAARGVPALDLLGANQPHLARFKENFSPTLHPYHQWRYSRHSLLRLVFSIRTRQ